MLSFAIGLISHDSVQLFDLPVMLSQFPVSLDKVCGFQLCFACCGC